MRALSALAMLFSLLGGLHNAAAAPTAAEVIPENLLHPLPITGAVPPMYTEQPGMIFCHEGAGVDEETERAAGQLRRKYFNSTRPQRRAIGLEELSALTNPLGFQTLYEELRGCGPDVMAALIEHFASHGEPGQSALAWMSIEDTNPAVRNEAALRITRPACNAVLATIDQALRSTLNLRVNNAGLLAGTLNTTAAIPLLIFAQYAADDRPPGDLAWIAIGRSISYVANVVPVVGDGSGGFLPVIGQVFEGVVLRVSDAVVYTLRADVHNSLVSLSSSDWGQSTALYAWDIPAWARWFNGEYVPFKQAQQQQPAAPPLAG